MSTVDEEIAELKKIIKGYDDELKNASTMEEKRVLRELIIVRSEMVIRLLDEKRASSGKELIVSFSRSLSLSLSERCEE